MRHWINFVTGAAGATINRTVKFVENQVNGEETSVNDIPMVRRIRGEVSKRKPRDLYYERITKVLEADAKQQYYEEQYPDDWIERLSKRELKQYGITEDAILAENALKKLYKERREVQLEKWQNPNAHKRALKQIDTEINEELLAFSRLYKKTVGRD